MIAFSSFAVVPLLSLHIFLPSAAAQSQIGEQCGGQGWTGPTICSAGSICTVVDEQSSFCKLCPKPTPNFWFSFGDSYSTTSLNSSSTLPSIGNPLGNPPYPGYTADGGENWVDFLTTTYNNSLILTYNFAWGGATIDAKLVTPGSGISLTNEVNTFLNKFASKPPSTPWQTDNTLFSVWIGINDVGDSYNQVTDLTTFSDELMNAYFELVEKLVSSSSVVSRDLTIIYQVGARNYLFINVPPMERSPLFLAQPASNQSREKAFINVYNSRLQTRIDWFSGNHSDVRLWDWDAHAAFTRILDNPTAYGFKDATSYGNNDPNYLWSGNYHPSSAAYRIFAEEISYVLSGSVWW